MSAAPVGRDSAEREYPADAAARLGDILTDLEVSFTSPQPGAFLVRLEGQHKLVTMTWLIADTHSLHVEAFFCRQPDENHAEFYRFLLERGSRMFGIHFALDQVGDVHLVGRLPLAVITTDEIDRLLGCVLSYSDDNFDQALMIGFASSIKREYAWRVKRGESLANLRAFTRLTEPEATTRPEGPEATSRPEGPEATSRPEGPEADGSSPPHAG